MSQTIFIADLHLSEHSPELTELFLRQLHQWQSTADALYILGDLFDAWVGDDDRTPFTDHIAAELKAFAQHKPVYFIPGNRDFLLGQDFASRSGMTLLPEQHPIILYGRQYLLTHGDELCTADLPYMQFRAQSRQPQWQAAILAKPLAERRLLAQQIRQMSERGKAENGKSAVSDVTEEAVSALMAQHPGADLIHGHTHRPATHRHTLPNGQSFTRFVLQDWYNKEGGCLVVSPEGVSAQHLALD